MTGLGYPVAVIRDAAIVRAVRVSKKMTQAKLADAADLSEVTIRRFERADERIEVPTRAAIAEAIGLSFDWRAVCVIQPDGFPEGAIDWEEAQIRKRAAARGVSPDQAKIDSPLDEMAYVIPGTAYRKPRNPKIRPDG